MAVNKDRMTCRLLGLEKHLVELCFNNDSQTMYQRSEDNDGNGN